MQSTLVFIDACLLRLDEISCGVMMVLDIEELLLLDVVYYDHFARWIGGPIVLHFQQ